MKPFLIGDVLIDPPLLQAPMAGFTNYAFRQVVRGFGGVGLPAIEMVSARGFLNLDARDRGYPDRLWGVRDEPRPLAVQIWDNDPGRLSEVASRLVSELQPSVIDINFGCPARNIAQKAESGSYLLRHPERVGDIVSRVVQASGATPVTAKIRLGYSRDGINAIDVAQAVESAGGAALTIHGRTTDAMYRGQADWDQIARVKSHLKRIPLIGNGDIRTAAAAAEAFARYGVDGVMIGRAALGRPWLFSQAAAALAGETIPPSPSLEEQRRLLLAHFGRVVERFGPGRGTILMRRFACCYAQGQPGARAFRASVSRVSEPAEFIAAVERFFPSEATPRAVCEAIGPPAD